jgi:hypothetical protein
MIGILLELFNLHVSLVALVLELLLEKIQRLVHLSHVFLFT